TRQTSAEGGNVEGGSGQTGTYLGKGDNHDALVFWGEDKVKRRVTRTELYDLVSRIAQALAAEGVGPGDRVAGYMPNMPETVAAMLAASSLGAIWSSTSPDFGVQGVLDRFGQIEAKVLFCADGYWYNGKSHGSLEKTAEIIKGLPTVGKVVICDYLGNADAAASIPNAVLLDQFVSQFEPQQITFAQLPFNHPLYIMFSSGTTGVPKCIVHGSGGTLLQQMKEHVLHSDVRRNDRVFYFTTCGWMMWNWLVAGLAADAALLLFDGAPSAPSFNILFDFAQAEKMTLLGTSAKFIDALRKAEVRPKETHDLSTVRALLSTGSPLVAEGFDYVYDSIKADVNLASVSGGTDILSCFMLGNPISPVWRGEIQGRGLGLAVDIFDDAGKPIRGEKGELVCTKPFPSMPIGFWNDPDGARYHGAYFDRFDNIWCHGDFVELTSHEGIVVYGRSDATLNPGGVRIGTAEIYRQVESLPEIEESLVIGQEWDDDVRVVLFVKLRSGLQLDDDLIKAVRSRIRQNTTPRHVPAKVVQVTDIPRTKSGKIVELAVREVVHGRQVKNKEALANPEALDLYAGIQQLGEA
ncbi:MAG: acetoacetate--CoA ligase, partial [Pseudomonadota bacterium]